VTRQPLTTRSHDDIPVARGREMPLRGNHALPASWRETADNFWGLTLPKSASTESNQTAVELLISTIQSSPQKVVLLALGPLTNVAEALQRAPELADNVEGIYVMGGALEPPRVISSAGIGIDNDVAGWNVYCDPYAANIVLESGVPVTLVPLDATNCVPVTSESYERIRDNHTSPEATLVFDLLTADYEEIEWGVLYFWDPLVAAVVTDESLATFQTMRLCFVEEAGSESGGTKLVHDGPEVRVAVSADRQRFERVFLDTPNGQLGQNQTP
jgi:inosine-uridine nucleoside N-ribohydrolase